MTHIEQFKEMLKSLNYSFNVVNESEYDLIQVSSDGDKVHGYIGFVADFSFNKDGSINNIGIYE